MNSYTFHIGDYYRDCEHLTQEQFYIYRRLLDYAYLTELPITSDIQWIINRFRLTSDQKSVLLAILGEYFDLDEDGYHQKRVERQLARVYTKSATAKANADARWNEYRRRQEKKKKNAAAMQAQCKPDAKSMLPLTLNPLTLNPLTPNPSSKDTPAPQVSDQQAESHAGNGKEIVKTIKIPPCPYQKIVDLYHELLPMCPRIVKLTDARRNSIKARWRTDADNLQFWRDYFTSVSESKFLTGRQNPSGGRSKPFVADIDFLIRPSTVVRVQEGKYHG